jgi:hypothetical protein
LQIAFLAVNGLYLFDLDAIAVVHLFFARATFSERTGYSLDFFDVTKQMLFKKKL